MRVAQQPTVTKAWLRKQRKWAAAAAWAAAVEGWTRERQHEEGGEGEQEEDVHLPVSDRMPMAIA